VPGRARGRPLKFGRRAQLVALTLPHDVLVGLRRIHPDPGWAIVSLYERQGRTRARRPAAPRRSVELARVSEDQALIVVDPRVVQSVPGVSVVPMSEDRAFLAFAEGHGLGDLELGLVDRLHDAKESARLRTQLTRLRRQIRDLRRSRHHRFSTRAIILVEGANGAGRTPRGSQSR
jgi:hypothetical protein